MSGYFATGQVLEHSYSGLDHTDYATGLIVLTGDIHSATLQASGDMSSMSGVQEQSVASDNQTKLTITSQEEASSAASSDQEFAGYTPDQQITLLQAVKHLIDTYHIPLSTSKSVKFTHIAKSHPDYPYMKTALEKKMIGSTTNPNLIVSCDVYVVMKGIAEGWTIKKTTEVKADYWKLASTKNKLNGCKQGEKLTFATL